MIKTQSEPYNKQSKSPQEVANVQRGGLLAPRRAAEDEQQLLLSSTPELAGCRQAAPESSRAHAGMSRQRARLCTPLESTYIDAKKGSSHQTRPEIDLCLKCYVLLFVSQKSPSWFVMQFLRSALELPSVGLCSASPGDPPALTARKHRGGLPDGGWGSARLQLGRDKVRILYTTNYVRKTVPPPRTT